MSKAGSSLLRTTLVRAADTARKQDPQLALIYYLQMIERGKNHLGALCVVAANLAERAWAVMNRGTPYVIRDTDGTPVTADQAATIIAQHWTVPSDVRSRRRSKNGKAPKPSQRDDTDGATSPQPIVERQPRPSQHTAPAGPTTHHLTARTGIGNQIDGSVPGPVVAYPPITTSIRPPPPRTWPAIWRGRASRRGAPESVILIVIEPQVSVSRRGGQMRKASASLASSSQLPRCAGAGDESCSSVESCDHRLFQLRWSLGCDGVEDVEAAGAPCGVEGGQHPEQRRGGKLSNASQEARTIRPSRAGSSQASS